jgi:hypothetical protein
VWNKLGKEARTVARKKQQSSKKDRCDVCGTVLDDQAFVQEFPDGSLARLCQDCAETAALGEEEAEDEYAAEDATREWEHSADDKAVPVAPLPEESPHQRGRGRGSAEGTEVDSELFQPEVFGAELFDFEHAASTGVPLSMDPQDEATARAAAELAAWASSESTGDDIEPDDQGEHDGETGYESEAVYDAETGYESASYDVETDYTLETDREETPEAELSAALAEADLAATARVEASAGTTQAEPGYAPESDQIPEAEVFLETDATVEVEIATVGQSDETALETDQVEDEVVASAPETQAGDQADAKSTDPEMLDKTKELLMPVTDLISLQSEMQSALARLSSTLEHFVTEMVASEDKTSLITERLRQLEEELEATRERLHETEALLPESVRPVPVVGVEAEETAPTAEPEAEIVPDQSAAAMPPPLPTQPVTPPPLPGTNKAAVAPPPLPAASGPSEGPTPPPLPGALPKSAAETGTPPPLPAAKTNGSAGTAALGAATGAVATAGTAAMPPPIPVPAVEPPGPSPSGAAAAVQRFLRGRKAQQEPSSEPEPPPTEPEGPRLEFQINEVQAAQRYFNESAFVKKIRDINRSIGKPKANLSRVAEGQPQAFVTVFWDIVWYQYLVDLRRELPADVQRIVLSREGMDLEELDSRFREKNATVNDDGRLDASELEVRLLSDPSALISEMDVVSEATVAREDATEEIWDQQSAPEFRWD